MSPRSGSRVLAQQSKSPVWRYFFTQVPTGLLGELYGARHAGELVYVFQALDAAEAAGNYTPSLSDREVEAAMGALWTSLASDGDPSALTGYDWPAYVPSTDPYLEIGETIAPGEGVRTERCDFWDSWTTLR